MSLIQMKLFPCRHVALARHIIYAGALSTLLIALAACSGISPEPGAVEPVEAAPVAAEQDSTGSSRAESTAPTDESSNEEIRRSPDRLQLPAIEADMPVVKLGWHVVASGGDSIVSEWDVAEYAAGWHKNSALPGEAGNIVMSGHNNIYGSVFRELDQLRKGDEAIVWTDGQPRIYEVQQVLVLPEQTAEPDQRIENAKWIGDFDEERLTLVSCWPRNSNTHRIIVVASPAPEADQASADATDAAAATP